MAISDKYKIAEHEKAHFLTPTVFGWIDVFTRNNHQLPIVESPKYCPPDAHMTSSSSSPDSIGILGCDA